MIGRSSCQISTQYGGRIKCGDDGEIGERISTSLEATEAAESRGKFVSPRRSREEVADDAIRPERCDEARLDGQGYEGTGRRERNLRLNSACT